MYPLGPPGDYRSEAIPGIEVVVHFMKDKLDYSTFVTTKEDLDGRKRRMSIDNELFRRAKH